MNISWSKKILKSLAQFGVGEIVFCPGARNSPLVTVLASSEGFGLHSFFEERAGAFYALGVARRLGRPVAIITTSGTASAELLPAIIEAQYTGVPLIAITADRPRRLRGTGAPQVIDQVGLFKKFVSHEFDLESGELFSLEDWNRRSPIHINVCFDEPLIDDAAEKFSFEPGGSLGETFLGTSSFPNTAGQEWASLRVTKFLRSSGPLVVVVGTLETVFEREACAGFLKRLGAPVYLESTSGLREREDLSHLAIRSGDKLLAWGLRQKMFTRVLRIGGVPTVRIWRDLDESTSPIDTLSLSALPFSGLSRGELVCAEITSTLNNIDVSLQTADFAEELLLKDRACERDLANMIAAEPLSEPSLFHSLSLLIPAGSNVYVGNSLPIREWDLAASFERSFATEANRGVNGIDGQLATFFGLAREGVENWAIVGDLTALYDLAAPWALKLRQGLKLRIVVINNSGGKIFSRIFRHELFENRHEIGFQKWAEMWGIEYRKWESIPESLSGADVQVIEVVPDNEASARFWDRYDNLWTQA